MERIKKLFLITLLLTTAIIQAQQPVALEKSYLIEDSILIPTKSGVNISAIIVRKKENTDPLPVILFYTTYLGPNDASIGKKIADNNYVGVIAYARGIRANINDYAPFEHETEDIYDIIDWISKQNWCNGKIAMYGGSYTGFSQWAATKKIHPALKTIVPQVAVMPGFDFPMENNIPTVNVLSWSNDNIYKRKPLPRDLPFNYFNTGISFRNLDSLAGERNPIFQKWLTHAAYDNYWQALVPTPNEYASLSIPILSTTGYYDGSQISALHYFNLYNKYNKSANHYLVIGPYDHWGGQRKAAKNIMGYTIDSVANINMQDVAFEWLDHILKDSLKPQLLKNKINYQVMGTNTWKHVATMDKMNNDTLTFYLDKNTLNNKMPVKKEYIEQRVDFNDRQNQNNYYTPQIIFDTLDASNGLIFKTDPFKEEFTINGSFTGALYTTINKKDIDISVALYELMPDGNYFFLTRYVGRASYSKNNEKRNLLTPNKKELVAFDNTRFISKKINKNSRLVILLNINKHPFEIINYGSGNDVNDETIKEAKETLQIKWHNDSYIKIPVWKEN